MTRGILSGLVVTAVLLGCRPASDAPDTTRAASQVVGDEQTLLSVVLPDLSGMHPAVQEQLREAYGSLMGLDSARTSELGARSDAYGELGKLFMAVGEYLVEAEQCFRHAQLLAPEEFRWPYYLGHVFMRQGDLTGSVEHFERALRLRPTDLAALVWVAHVYIDVGRPEATEPHLASARSLYPGTQAVLFELGRAALEMQDYASAVEHLEGALRVNPTATHIHYPLAMAHRGLGNLETAQHHLDQSGGRAAAGGYMPGAVALPDPLLADVASALRSPQAYRELALAADAKGDWPEAATQFRKAVEMSPADAVLRLSLGMALNKAGEPRAALVELEEAVRLDPNRPRAHFTIGTILERGGRDRDAIDHFTAAVTHAPDSGEGHLKLADALRRTGRLDASLAQYRRVLELDPEAETARFGEALALVRLARHQEARERLRVAMDRHAGQMAFPNALARLLATSPDDQVRDGRRALALAQALLTEHKTTAVAETMAMALAELGQFTLTAEWQNVAMTVATQAGRPDIAERMAANLARYQRHEPCRRPWRNDEPEYRPGPEVEPGLLDLPPSF